MVQVRGNCANETDGEAATDLNVFGRLPVTSWSLFLLRIQSRLTFGARLGKTKTNS